MYELIRSKRKTISIELEASGMILVRAPILMPKWRIEKFVSDHKEWICRARARQAKRLEKLPQLREEDKPMYIKQAKEIIPEKVKFYAEIMGVKPTGITITSAKTRFGSCSATNRLSFSWRLMAFPESAIDYVVVHELSHIIHKNHSRDFYQCIEDILPDYRERIKILKGK